MTAGCDADGAGVVVGAATGAGAVVAVVVGAEHAATASDASHTNDNDERANDCIDGTMGDRIDDNDFMTELTRKGTAEE